GYEAGKRIGALFFMHGWRSNPANVMRNAELKAFVDARGLALVAPKSAQDGWDIAGSPSERSQTELPFFDRLLGVLTERHGIATDQLVATGFSAGGMMVWNLICYRGDKFRAFIPIAGTYWRPIPQTCDTPSATVLHIHGLDDPMVPMTGRKIRHYQQGDVRRALTLYRAQSALAEGPPITLQRNGLRCAFHQRADHTAGGTGLCLHDGGHWYRSSDLALAFDLLAKVGVQLPGQR
ncbi:MAG: polyhydroxybutyrate depolymerase, partial [Pseudomonadota bacterium]